MANGNGNGTGTVVVARNVVEKFNVDGRTVIAVKDEDLSGGEGQRPLSRQRRRSQARAQKPKTDPELKDDWIKTVLTRHQASVAHTAKWRKEARQAHNYYESAQTPTALTGRSSRKTFHVNLNMVRGRTDTKTGILSAGRPIPEVTGMGMEDFEAAETLADLHDHALHDVRYPAKREQAIHNSIVTGVGILRPEINPDEEQVTAHGRVPGRYGLVVDDSLKYYPDPRNREPSWWGENGANWYSTLSQERLSDLAILYPEMRDQILNLPARVRRNVLDSLDYYYKGDAGGGSSVSDSTDDSGAERPQEYPDETTVEVLTHWYIEKSFVERVYYTDPETRVTDHAVIQDVERVPVIDPQTGVQAVNPEDGQPAFEESVSTRPMTREDLPKGNSSDDPRQQRRNYDIRRRTVKNVRVCGLAGNILLYDRPTPYKHQRWPIVVIAGTMFRDQAMAYGEIHNLFEIQDLYNRVNSLVIENAVKSNNAGWQVEAGALDPAEERRLRTRGSEPGFILKVRRGRMRMVERIEPGRLSDGIYRLSNDLRVMIDELSSLYQTQRGGMPYETSGRAVIALQQAGDLALKRLQTNIEDALTDLGNKTLSIIQQYYTWERSWRISNKMRDKTYFLKTQLDVPINAATGERLSDTPTLHLYKVGENGSQEAVELLKDFTVAEYDVKVRISTEHTRDPSEELAEIQYLRAIGAVDNEWVLTRLKVENRDALIQRMNENNQLLQLGQSILEATKNEEDPTDAAVAQLAVSPSGRKAIARVFEQIGLDPSALVQTTSGGGGLPTPGAAGAGVGVPGVGVGPGQDPGTTPTDSVGFPVPEGAVRAAPNQNLVVGIPTQTGTLGRFAHVNSANGVEVS